MSLKLHLFILFALSGALTKFSTVFAGEPPITALSFTPEANHVVAVSQSGVQVFTWPKLDHIRTIETSTPNLHCLAFAPNRKHLAVGGGAPSEEGVVEVFSWPQGERVARFAGHKDSVRSLVWQDHVKLLTGSIDRDIKLWHLENESSAISTLKGHSRSVDAICLIENGQTLVSTGADLSLRVWNVETGALIRSLNQHTKPVNALSLRPAKNELPMIASASQDRTIRFWQPTIGRMMRYIRLKSEPLNITWTNDGGRILASCVDGHVRVIDSFALTVTQDLPAIDGWAYAMAIHPNDQSVVIGGMNGQIRRMEHLLATPLKEETR
ncbi:MAG: WD40 repeat domain-containing protein [Verrucomicrobiota bacterium]|nr:WD40 repeat domain-containing protein [Verrucomicrobiota bacterium]